jgi:checkpoint serine/threonine-protein kinase
MADPVDATNFDTIEGHKENIQALPSGRSAKKLAALFSPRGPLQQVPTPTDTRHANDAARMQFEAEIAAIDESDDPLDVYGHYVKWTLDTYPSAQATPQSGLRNLLERATRAFIGSDRYRNDPRYVRLWVHYINFFSDAPREAYVFLSRHSIGETLALYYEEYASWLEGAGRWAQAHEIYRLGIERDAQPAARLLRKMSEFDQRRMAHQQQHANSDADGPASPALPAVRPVLAAKVDPFVLTAAAAAPVDPQAVSRQTNAASRSGPSGSKPAKAKMAIFSDTDEAMPPAAGSRGPESKGWDSIGSAADRRKENTMEARPWVGETLKAGGKKPSGPKMAIFRDTVSLPRLCAYVCVCVYMCM